MNNFKFLCVSCQQQHYEDINEGFTCAYVYVVMQTPLKSSDESDMQFELELT